jgi:hypothetical protein
LKLLWETRRREREWNEAQARAESASTPAAVATARDGQSASPGPPPPYTLTDQYAAIMRARIQVADPAFRADLEPRKDYAFKHLDKMKDRLQALGIDFGVLIYPDEFQVDVGLRQSLLEREGIDAAGYDWELPQALVAAWCDKHAVAYLDLLPTFREVHDSGQRLYLLNDSHWNEAGNALAAEEIAAWIEPRALAFLEGRASPPTPGGATRACPLPQCWGRGHREVAANLRLGGKA